ncbi:MAG: YihY/virulence factor BrkB family protein [Terracidiphilus sp.]
MNRLLTELRCAGEMKRDGAWALKKELRVADISNGGSGVADERSSGVVRAADVVEPAQKSKWYRWRKDGTALISYLLDSEVHTFAFSVAANAILSFIPFIVLLYTLSRSVFHSEMMVTVVNDMVTYFLPSNQGFVASNLARVATAASRHGVQVFSLIMILVACTGIFLPLEVALNQAWGVTKSRNYLHNQVIAFGLAILMVLLALASILLNAVEQGLLTFVFFHHTDNFVFKGISYVWLAATTGVASILFFFSIYWLLPNRKVPWRPVMHSAVYTGIIWLAAKYIFVTVLPHLDLEALYGQFYVSVGLLFWAYISGLILFAGAQFSVARMGNSRS